jgi:hypothetical protein
MFVWTFLLRITHTIISQSSADSSWISLYIYFILILYLNTTGYPLLKWCSDHDPFLKKNTKLFWDALIPKGPREGRVSRIKMGYLLQILGQTTLTHLIINFSRGPSLCPSVFGKEAVWQTRSLRCALISYTLWQELFGVSSEVRVKKIELRLSNCERRSQLADQTHWPGLNISLRLKTFPARNLSLFSFLTPQRRVRDRRNSSTYF